MISIFTRRELFVTFSTQEQARVRDALTAAGIEYKITTVNRTSPAAVSAERARTDSFGLDGEMVTTYTFYVHRHDYELAQEAIGQGSYLH